MEILGLVITWIMSAWSFIAHHWQEVLAAALFFRALNKVSDLEHQVRVLEIDRNAAQSDLSTLWQRVEFLLEENARRDR